MIPEAKNLYHKELGFLLLSQIMVALLTRDGQAVSVSADSYTCVYERLKIRMVNSTAD